MFVFVCQSPPCVSFLLLEWLDEYWLNEGETCGGAVAISPAIKEKKLRYASRLKDIFPTHCDYRMYVVTVLSPGFSDRLHEELI